MPPLQEIQTMVQDLVSASAFNVEKLLQSLVILAGLWLLRRLIFSFALERIQDIRTRYQWQKITTYVLTILGLVLLAIIWRLRGIQSLATFLGLLTAGLAIALRDPIANVAGWIFVVVRKPFSIGDRIEIGNHAGDVVDVRLFAFSLAEIGRWVEAEQSTGRIIHIPNKDALALPVINYSQGLPYIWHEIPVLITFESDWRTAKQIMHDIAVKHTDHFADSARHQLRKVARKFMLIYTTLTPTVYTSVRESGVLLTIRCLSEPRGRRGLTQAMWEDILIAFAEHDTIELAYPTQRLYFREAERLQGPPRGDESF